MFLTIFRRHFKSCPNHTNVSECFPKFSQTTEDCRTQRVKLDFKHYVIDINYQFQLFPRLEILVQNGRLDYKKTENIPEHKKQPIIAKQLDLLAFVKGK